MLPDVQEIRIHFYNFLKIFFPILFWKWQQLLHGRLGWLGFVCLASFAWLHRDDRWRYSLYNKLIDELDKA